MEKRQISFSPPDITEAEVSAVADALRSGWITTGPRTKEFEKRIAKLCGTDKAVALGSATACLESILRFLGIGAGDEVDRKSTRLNSSHTDSSRMPSSA